MCSKLKVCLLTGFFLLIATAVSAEPFWYFHTGHVVKYTRTKANGEEWPVTVTVGAGGQEKCGSNDYYKVDEYNYNNDGATETKYLRVTETEGWVCNGDTEIKYLQVGPEGTTWTYPDPLGDNGVQFKVVSNTRFGALITIRRLLRSGGNWGKEEYTHYHKGYGKYREIDYIDAGDNPPWIQGRHGYRGGTLYATFADGLYVYDYDGKSTWTRISSVPASMVVAGPNLYATWTGQGLYVWDGNVWTRISSVPASMVPANSKLYATWVGQGLYVWNGSGTWTKISSVPDRMVAAGKYLYATWPGQGLYKWDGATWTRISSVPVNIMPGTLSGQ